MRRFKTRILGLTTALLLIAAPAAAGVGGFDGPLFGLDSGRNGTLLVADASAGIHIVKRGDVKTTIPLPGATDASAFGWKGMWATTGAGEDPEADTGQAVHRIVRGEPHLVANLFAFEEAYNPDGGFIDSNPFDVAALNRWSALVVDSGGNDLLKVNKRGHVKVLAVFPSEIVSTDNIKALAGCPNPPDVPEIAELCFLPDEMPAEAVPTSVAIGPDGWYYVSELKGFPAPTGESNIWRVHPRAHNEQCPSPKCQKVFDGGFTSIMDLDFDKHGRLIVAELDEASWAAVEIFGGGDGGTVSKCNISTHRCWEIATGIPILTAVTAVRHHIYATQNALIPGLAEVIRIK